MPTSNSVLFDTNILVYCFDGESPFNTQAVIWRGKSVNGEIKGVLSSQNISEFTKVLLDPKQSRVPIASKVVSMEIAKYRNLQSSFSIIYPNSKTLDIFEELVTNFPPKGSPQRIFDVFLVATMLGNNISTILTANTKDFAPFPQIKVIDLLM